jgi:DNA recombination protein RmuC
MELGLIVLGVAIVAAAGIVAFALRRRAPEPAPVPLEPPRPDPRIDTVMQSQGAIAERFQQTIEAQTQLQNVLASRIEALDARLGETLSASATRTAATISSIGERLTVIDEAQKNISALSGQVVSLQQVLANKQARGAFAQTQMEEIVRDGLPVSLYDFQYTLSNRNRPDCVIHIPGNKALVVIDAKFPLECFRLLRTAVTDEERKFALARVRSDVGKHVMDIAERYLIPGEVQTPAIMFVPSESIYADLHEQFEDVIQRAHKAQVIVVSPNILMLAINTIQTVMKDARMREQANQIQKEVGALLNDVRLLGDRVGKLQTHFTQADADIKNILVSTAKITGRAERIEKVELSPPSEEKTLL